MTPPPPGRQRATLRWPLPFGRGTLTLGVFEPRGFVLEIAVLCILCAALILLGLAGTVLPLLPGTLLVWGGIALGAWIDDFTRVGMTTVAVVSVLAAMNSITAANDTRSTVSMTCAPGAGREGRKADV